MNNRKLSGAAGLLVSAILLASCSSVRVAGIEKRRYRDGYYVQTTRTPQKADSFLAQVQATIPVEKEKSTKIFTLSKMFQNTIKENIKIERISERAFATDRIKPRVITALDDVLEERIFIGNHRSIAAVGVHQKDLPGTMVPGGERGGIVIGTMALIILAVFLLLFFVWTMQIILALAVAIIFSIVVVFILKSLKIIKD